MKMYCVYLINDYFQSKLFHVRSVNNCITLIGNSLDFLLPNGEIFHCCLNYERISKWYLNENVAFDLITIKPQYVFDYKTFNLTSLLNYDKQILFISFDGLDVKDLPKAHNNIQHVIYTYIQIKILEQTKK